MTYPDVKVSYVELMEVVNSREQLGQVTNGNTFREIIVSDDPTNQLSIWHSEEEHINPQSIHTSLQYSLA